MDNSQTLECTNIKLVDLFTQNQCNFPKGSRSGHGVADNGPRHELYKYGRNIFNDFDVKQNGSNYGDGFHKKMRYQEGLIYIARSCFTSDI